MRYACRCTRRIYAFAKANKIEVLEKEMRYVNYFYFHIKDKKWGHVTIGISPHPPFAAKIIVNGHDWLSLRADQRQQRRSCAPHRGHHQSAKGRGLKEEFAQFAARSPAHGNHDQYVC
jgi:hypothetical protein